MRMDFQIRSHRRKKAAAAALREDRPLRVAGLLALAHRFEGLLQTGAVKDYAELARLGHVSRARITQIMNLMDLAVPIQEHVLGVHPAPGLPTIITEKQSAAHSSGGLLGPSNGPAPATTGADGRASRQVLKTLLV